MTTLHVRGAGGTQFLTWVLTDDTTELATATNRLASDTMEIDARGRRLTARRTGRMFGSARELSVTDSTTGQTSITGKVLASSDSPPYREWEINFPSGASLTWFYQGEPRKLGFFEPDGTPLIEQGHDPAFDAPKNASGRLGTLRILLSFWKGALASANRYLVHVADDAVGRAVDAADVPILALLGVWLQAEAEADADSGGMSA
jgi:hypothetical protein